MRVVYTIGIAFYTLGIRVAASFGHRKARLMVAGWRCWEQQVEALDSGRATVWFHASSLGEFEQARPVLEAYRQVHPERQVLVTFFSPSGYEVRKSYPNADCICYLPMDLPRNARKLVAKARPMEAFFVKYDFWFNYLDVLNDSGAKVYLFSAIFRQGQYFFKPWGRWFLKQLGRCFDHLFVQNEESVVLLQRHGVKQVSLAGDTRFDRVHQIAIQGANDEVVEHFLEGYDGHVLICGSTWPPDERLLATVLKGHPQGLPEKIIVAPHEIGEEHLVQIEQLFGSSIRYSRFASYSGETVLLIDNIGLLSKLYRYADVAYIGGGFGVGIHNILEAITYGIPVVFGPNYHKFQEARDMVVRGGGFAIANNPSQVSEIFVRLMSDADFYYKSSMACTNYMKENLGSTKIILDTIEE